MSPTTRCLSACVLLLAPGLLLAGCETTIVTTKGGRQQVIHVDDEERYQDKTEVQLLAAAEEQPDDARGWFRLGDYYERMRRLPDALAAYERMQACIEKEEARTGQRYVRGLYLLGRTHALLRSWAPAVEYLRRVVAVQPKSLQMAVLSPSFKEAHFLLGAIYFEHRQYPTAEQHLVTFNELDGYQSRRADGMLMAIERELRPEGAMGSPEVTSPAPASAPAQQTPPAEPQGE